MGWHCIVLHRILKGRAILKFDTHRLPWVDELLDQLEDAQYITTLDLMKGYWQILLTLESREKTAFATPLAYTNSGQYLLSCMEPRPQSRC